MLTLRRTKTPKKTTGVLTMPDGYEIETIERPDLNNKPFVSCIPEGIYRVERNKTGKHQYYALRDVPNRSFIEIHPASKVSQLEGCIGMRKADCDRLLSWFGDNDWVLEVV